MLPGKPNKSSVLRRSLVSIVIILLIAIVTKTLSHIYIPYAHRLIELFLIVSFVLANTFVLVLHELTPHKFDSKRIYLLKKIELTIISIGMLTELFYTFPDLISVQLMFVVKKIMSLSYLFLSIIGNYILLSCLLISLGEE